MVLRLRLSPPGQWRDAKCSWIRADASYDPFFDPDDMQEAMVFCNGDADGIICPIRDECLRYALTNNLKEGIWGGCSELTRRALRRRWPLQGRQPRPEWHWMSRADALKGVRLIDLQEDDDEDEEDFMLFSQA